MVQFNTVIKCRLLQAGWLHIQHTILHINIPSELVSIWVCQSLTWHLLIRTRSTAIKLLFSSRQWQVTGNLVKKSPSHEHSNFYLGTHWSWTRYHLQQSWHQQRCQGECPYHTPQGMNSVAGDLSYYNPNLRLPCTNIYTVLKTFPK